MSFSLNTAEPEHVVSFVEVVFVWGLFLIARYGGRLGESLEDQLEPFPRVVKTFFTAAGWLAAITAALPLIVVASSYALCFASLGLLIARCGCSDQAWLCIAAAPVVVAVLRRQSRSGLIELRVT